ncbi:Uncharacterised protein [Pragia fontium]|uniref:Uncharacterized protein n=2 Tax=Pragia fontium TaxID=82985 RepID=A0AAJ4W9R9_9GAMM|nr:hypothetical protein [Pragia fontium]AKJ43238.1 hypothetical protein QQ39_15190 [Pragia fontium]GKX64043.1 hypothetical protein SOASR032_26120 [Pragia fontium]SFC61475.1 hypothetical protein SAMN02745723_103118 [Pragia fontium DSM 5563 = ATCC 49100]SUB83689.1 Uncharacterised protein [Pragia fontium]
MTKKHWIVMVFVILSSILGVLFIWKASLLKVGSHIPECRATTEFNKNGYRAPLIVNFRVDKDKGLIFYEGPVFLDNKLVGIVNRQIEFTVKRMPGATREHGTVNYQSYNVTVFPKDNLSENIAEKILHNFFIKNNSSIYFDIFNMKDGAILINDNIPLFYCRHVQKN